MVGSHAVRRAARVAACAVRVSPTRYAQRGGRRRAEAGAEIGGRGMVRGALRMEWVRGVWGVWGERRGLDHVMDGKTMTWL